MPKPLAHLRENAKGLFSSSEIRGLEGVPKFGRGWMEPQRHRGHREIQRAASCVSTLCALCVSVVRSNFGTCSERRLSAPGPAPEPDIQRQEEQGGLEKVIRQLLVGACRRRRAGEDLRGQGGKFAPTDGGQGVQ